MMLTVFATCAMAQELEYPGVPAVTQEHYAAICTTGSGNIDIQAASTSALFQQCEALIVENNPFECFSVISGITSFSSTVRAYVAIDHETGICNAFPRSHGGIVNNGRGESEVCPPPSSPEHIYPVQTETGLMCHRAKYKDSECPEPTAADPYIFGTAVSPSNVCYKNPESDTQCNIETDDAGGYFLPTKYNSQEPVECKSNPPPKDPNEEDKFCYVHGNEGTYSVDCPTTNIQIDITQMTQNADQLVVNHERLSNIEASFISQQDIDNLMASGELKGDKGEKGDQGEKGEKGDQGAQGIQGIQGVAGADGADGKDGTNGIDGINGEDGQDGEDGEGCSIVSTMSGATISCGESQSELSNGNCSTESLSNGDTKVTCPDGSESTVNGVDEDGIIGALGEQLTELKKQTDELKAQSESLENIGTYDGEKPVIDYETKPDGYNEIAEFDWESENFGTVLEEHNQAMRQLPIVTAIESFFTTSFGGSCPTWSETVTVLDASFTVTIDQFCSSAVQNILPMIRAILMLVAGFFAWRIAIE